ncbi:MAG: anhydro-N-acetylmuramic acid kinase [Cyclobacteriaceae bacterium]|nr:anhydro-N-acetylmuramic acid kinase [Cyclobacteriaceae bacterium]
MKNSADRPELIVSHGHTIFHQPGIGLTLQIGDGYRIMKKTGIKTVCDLRSLDVALGGQGAPFVPIGDKLLFPQYDFCLNLGGFSNISTDIDGRRIAYDICPVNTVLNFLASRVGFDFDKDGEIARSGKPVESLLEILNNLPYYKLTPPKSLGIEWVNSYVLPLLQGHEVADLMHTFCRHIAHQIAVSIPSGNTKRSVLVTGGGAKNTFLIEMIKNEIGKNAEVVIPDEQTVDFKEAIIFGFLGLLRALGQVNTLKSVTGASADSSGGIIFDHLIRP